LNLSARGRNRFDRRLFFREQAKRATIGVVSLPALRKKPTQSWLSRNTEIMGSVAS
jgi:hypothetical protein